MDMMGGVLEVKKEDILRMVRFLDILVEGGMGWWMLLKFDHFCYMNLSFKNSTAINRQPLNTLYTYHIRQIRNLNLPSNLTKKQTNRQNQTTTLVFVSTESRDNTAPVILQIHQETFSLIPDIYGILGASGIVLGINISTRTFKPVP